MIVLMRRNGQYIVFQPKEISTIIQPIEGSVYRFDSIKQHRELKRYDRTDFLARRNDVFIYDKGAVSFPEALWMEPNTVSEVFKEYLKRDTV